MIIKREEIVGVQEGEKLLCCECAEKEGIKFDDPNLLFLSSEIEKTDDLFFCDNCNKPIKEI